MATHVNIPNISDSFCYVKIVMSMCVCVFITAVIN